MRAACVRVRARAVVGGAARVTCCGGRVIQTIHVSLAGQSAFEPLIRRANLALRPIGGPPPPNARVTRLGGRRGQRDGGRQKDKEKEQRGRRRYRKRDRLVQAAKSMIGISQQGREKPAVIQQKPPLSLLTPAASEADSDARMPVEVQLTLKSVRVFGRFSEPVFLDLIKAATRRVLREGEVRGRAHPFATWMPKRHATAPRNHGSGSCFGPNGWCLPRRSRLGCHLIIARPLVASPIDSLCPSCLPAAESLRAGPGRQQHVHCAGGRGVFVRHRWWRRREVS